MTATWCEPGPKGLRLFIQVAPNAKKTEVAGLAGDALKIRLHAQPIEGKANEALIRFIAERLKVPKSAISITHGQTAKRKTLLVAGCSLSALAAAEMLLP